MIIVRLQGRLGNQLFQYAFGRALSVATNQTLLFDHRMLIRNKQLHKLDNFLMEVNCSIPFFISTLINIRHGLRKVANLVYNRIGSVQFYDECNLQYNKQLFNECTSGVNYYEGYWGSPLYFNNIRPLLLKELKLKASLLSPLGLSLSKAIEKENAVSIHIRRGDYLLCPSIYKICSLEYYQQAVEYFVKKEKDVCFYIFSDDMIWTKANLKIDQAPAYYIEQTADYEDLHLMSKCKHHIIANSTFSWWGAWLNSYSLKQVIAPKDWFTPEFVADLDNLIPKEWIRM